MRGDIRDMSVREFLLFVMLVAVVGMIASILLMRLFFLLTMSAQAAKKRLEKHDLMEMNELLEERAYYGTMYSPVGC